jgi:hypothetical protein
MFYKKPLPGFDEKEKGEMGREETHFMPEFTNSSLSHSFGCNLDKCSNVRLRNTANLLRWMGLGGKHQIMKVHLHMERK